MTQMFVSLPVTDLERAKAFYTAVGFTINPTFSDHNSACVVVDDGHCYLMLSVREFLQTHTDLPLGDPKKAVSSATLFFLDDRAAVDVAVEAGVAAGGTADRPAADFGFMYQRQITDPDGNVLEFGYMDPVAAEHGPEAYAAQQA